MCLLFRFFVNMPFFKKYFKHTHNKLYFHYINFESISQFKYLIFACTFIFRLKNRMHAILYIFLFYLIECIHAYQAGISDCLKSTSIEVCIKVLRRHQIGTILKLRLCANNHYKMFYI